MGKKGSGAHRVSKLSADQKREFLWDSINRETRKDIVAALQATSIEAHTRHPDTQLTLIQHACEQGKDKSLGILLDYYQRRRILRPKGWLYLRCGPNGDTPLHVCVRSRSNTLKCVDELLQCEFNFYAKNGDGVTALELAESLGQKKMVAKLQEWIAEDSDDSLAEEGGSNLDGLTSTQRSKLKRLNLQKEERKGKASESFDDNDFGSSAVVKKVEEIDAREKGPTPKWPEVASARESMEKLDPVHELTVVRVNETKVDPALFYLFTLNFLSLQMVSLEKFSSNDCFKRMTHLSTLVLNNNSLSELPSSLSALPIKILELSHNRLTNLPEWISSSKILEKLDVSFNQLVQLSVFGCENLATLNCSSNFDLKVLKANWENKKRFLDLACSHTDLTEIPDPLPPTLVSLICESSKITHAPISICGCKKIAKLKMHDGNPISDPKTKRYLREASEQGGLGVKNLSKYLQKNGDRLAAARVKSDDSDLDIDSDEL